MSVGYQVSPVHQLAYLDLTASHERPIISAEDEILDTLAAATGVKKTAAPMRLRSPSVKSVLEWRQRIATKFRDQLGEELNWNERSTFESSEDVATSGDLFLHYVAAVLDQRGPPGLRELIGRGRPRQAELEAALTEADRRGFGGHFPQFLMGANAWLPYERNLMIEEADWDGEMNRYGSIFCFVDEMTTLRGAISEADPSVVRSVETDDPGEQVLVAAWQTSAPILRLATLAVAKHLPLLTTG